MRRVTPGTLVARVAGDATEGKAESKIAERKIVSDESVVGPPALADDRVRYGRLLQWRALMARLGRECALFNRRCLS